jgi:hypothetical protein
MPNPTVRSKENIMFKLIKRIAIAAIVVMAASAPSAAYARFNLDPGTAPVVSSQKIQNAVPPRAAKASASSSQGFQWDDAGIGAAGALVLVSVGSGTMLARRRRTHHPLTG